MVFSVAATTMKDSVDEDAVKVGLLPPRRRPVARILFGPVDHDENKRHLRRQLQEMEMATILKWNFDFRECLPLEGPYKWEKVEQVELEASLSPAGSEDVDLRDRSSPQSIVSRCGVDPSRIGGDDSSGNDATADGQHGLTTSTSGTTGRDLPPRAGDPTITTTTKHAAHGAPRGKRQLTLGRFYRVKKRRPERVKALKGIN